MKWVSLEFNCAYVIGLELFLLLNNRRIQNYSANTYANLAFDLNLESIVAKFDPLYNFFGPPQNGVRNFQNVRYLSRNFPNSPACQLGAMSNFCPKSCIGKWLCKIHNELFAMPKFNGFIMHHSPKFYYFHSICHKSKRFHWHFIREKCFSIQQNTKSLKHITFYIHYETPTRITHSNCYKILNHTMPWFFFFK